MNWLKLIFKGQHWVFHLYSSIPDFKGIVQIKILVYFYSECAGIACPFPNLKYCTVKLSMCIYICIYCKAFLLYQRYFLTFCLFLFERDNVNGKGNGSFFFFIISFLCNRKACFKKLYWKSNENIASEMLIAVFCGSFESLCYRFFFPTIKLYLHTAPECNICLIIIIYNDVINT